jgi:hypothetical protein
MPDNPLFVPMLRPNPLGMKPAINTKTQTQPQVALRAADAKTEAKIMSAAKAGKKTGKKDKKRGKRDNSDPPPYMNATFSDSSSDSSSSNDNFSVDNKRTLFYDDNRSEPVTFDMDVKDTTATMPLSRVQTENASSGVDDTRLMINFATYSREQDGTGNSIAGYPVYDHYKTLFAQMSKTVMATVKSKLIDQFTFSNFYNYMQIVSHALQVYYTTDAILSYTSKTDDKNSGIIAFQQKLTEADIFTAQNELRRALKGHWFPSKFSQLIRWTFQIYKTSPTNQGCNYMFLPNQQYLFIDGSTDIVTPLRSLIDDQINNLQDGAQGLTFSKLASVLGQVYPESVIRGLPLSANHASYDPQHYEIFVNQPSHYEGASDIMTAYPAIDTQPELVYVRACNPGERSGLPFCLQSIYMNHALSPEQNGGAGSIDFFQAFHQVGISTEVSNKTNKFTLRYNNGSIGFIARNLRDVTNESADVHIVAVDAVGSTFETLSSPKSGFQRVYFDNATAPLITLRTLMDSLYDFVI